MSGTRVRGPRGQRRGGVDSSRGHYKLDVSCEEVDRKPPKGDHVEAKEVDALVVGLRPSHVDRVGRWGKLKPVGFCRSDVKSLRGLGGNLRDGRACVHQKGNIEPAVGATELDRKKDKDSVCGSDARPILRFQLLV